MNISPVLRYFGLLCFLATVAFARPSIKDVIEIGPDTYLITASSAFSGTSKKDAIVRVANEFAKSKGKVAVAISLKETHPAVGLGGQFEYQFKLVSPSIVQSQVAPDSQPDKSKVQQMYVDLIRLNELKERKIITEEEFSVQKQRLLENTKPGKSDQTPVTVPSK